MLVNDDRLRCEDPQISNVLQPLSFAIIISFAFGVPIVFAAIMFAKAKSHAESFQNLFEISSVHSSSQTLQEFQRACKTDASAAAAVLVHRDVTCLNEFAFMIESYRPDVTYWESLDMHDPKVGAGRDRCIGGQRQRCSNCFRLDAVFLVFCLARQGLAAQSIRG